MLIYYFYVSAAVLLLGAEVNAIVHIAGLGAGRPAPIVPRSSAVHFAFSMPGAAAFCCPESLLAAVFSPVA